MQLLDIFILIPLIVGAYWGFLKGLFYSAGKLIALLAAFVLAVFFCDYLVPVLHFLPFKEALKHRYLLIAFVLSFAFFLLVTYKGLRFLSHKGFSKIKMEGLDAVLGAFLGMSRFGFFVAIGVMLIQGLDKRHIFLSQHQRMYSKMYQQFTHLNAKTLDFFMKHPNMTAMEKEVNAWKSTISKNE